MVYSNNDPNYRQCSVTVMDNIADPTIRFDENGICNYVHEYKQAAKAIPSQAEAERKLNQIISAIKIKGKGKKYDCLIGLSGGVDSTYVALLVKKFDLRPLAVHLDNGWNSELAVKNIENIVKKLNIDLHTLVVNWPEFKDIQLSYIKASVVDIEVVTDHAILATMFKLARQYNIGYIISGTNIVTEFIMPPTWIYNKMDCANLTDIHDQFGQVKLKTYPTLSFKKFVYYSAITNLSQISILDSVPYNKATVKKIIAHELGWRDYGGKHYESIFTKFYQAYILPEKFKIDKRKAHLSTLICSGQISKADAILELEKPLYAPDDLVRDKEYVLKKLGMNAVEFDQVMQLMPRRHGDFKTDALIRRHYMSFLRSTQRIRQMIRKKKETHPSY